MEAPEVIDAEFAVIDAPASPQPTWSDYVLAVVLLGILAVAGAGAALGTLSLLDRINWPVVGLVVAGLVALGLIVRFWRLSLAIVALAAIVAILGGFGLLVPILVVLAVLALLAVVLWGVISTVSRL